MGAFAVGVPITVGDMGSSEREHEAWLEIVEDEKESLRPLVPALTELADVYLRGDHSYKFLRDRLDPVFPEEPKYSEQVVSLSLIHERLDPWLRARKNPSPEFDFRHVSLGLASRWALTPWEKDKIAAGFHLSQRGPGGYLHEWRPRPGSLRGPELQLFEHQLSGRFTGRVEIDDLVPSILEGGRLPAVAGEAFEQWPRPMQAWDVATSVWMLAQDGDLAPWKAFCVERARLKFPDGDEFIPDWVTGSRQFPGGSLHIPPEILGPARVPEGGP